MHPVHGPSFAGNGRGNLFAVEGKVGAMYGWTSTTGAVPLTSARRGQDVDLTYGTDGTARLACDVQLRVDWHRYDPAFRGLDGGLDMLRVAPVVRVIGRHSARVPRIRRGSTHLSHCPAVTDAGLMVSPAPRHSGAPSSCAFARKPFGSRPPGPDRRRALRRR